MDTTDAVADFRRELESRVHRDLQRGMLTDFEIPPRVLTAYARAVEELPDDATARPFANAAVVGFTDAVAEFDCPTEASTVVALALQVYQHPSVVPPKPWGTRISRTWHIVDEDHPGLRGRALDDVRHHGASSGCLKYLWNGPDVAELLGQLIGTAPSLDKKLTLVSQRTGIFHDDDTAVLEVVSTALSEFDFDAAQRGVDCLNMDSTSVGDAERATLRRIVEEIPAQDDRDPFGRRAVACIVMAGRYGDDDGIVDILSRPNSVAAVSSSHDDSTDLRRGLILGRAALAAYLADDPLMPRTSLAYSWSNPKMGASGAPLGRTSSPDSFWACSRRIPVRVPNTSLPQPRSRGTARSRRCSRDCSSKRHPQHSTIPHRTPRGWTS